MEIPVDTNIPQGFDLDDGHGAAVYKNNPEGPQPQYEDDGGSDIDEDNVQPIYYHVPPATQAPSSPPPPQDSMFNNVNPVIWMVIIFVAFILGFFMGMGSGGKGGQSPIILAPRGNM